jgi:hypothetical protein
MRPQQNRRMRGRGGNNNSNNNNQNRKSPNPLTRSYESNGPDVKIRGTAQQVAEKYTTLWREAQASGDRVMAENYLQHAEHYNRLIAAAMLVQNQQTRSRDDDDEDRDDQDDSQSRDDQQSRDEQPRGDQPRGEQPRGEQGGRGSGPQPVIEGMPAEVAHEQAQIASGKAPRSKPASEARTNGSDEPRQAAESGEEEQAPRRARRPRRPRVKAGEGEAENGTDVQPEGELAQAVND